MKHVLIAYDGSPCAEAAVEDLSKAGLPAEMAACVLSVADVWLPSNPDGPQPEFPAASSPAVRKARESALAALNSAGALAARTADRLKTIFPKWQIESAACADSPGWGILTKAANWKADLVMLGSHGRSTLERLFLGSVSQKVAAEAVCSVRIARPRQQPHHSRLRIVVAVDGSPDSLKAVRAAADRVWPDFCEFRIVTVLDPRLESAIALPEGYGALWAQEHDVAARDAICRMVEHSAKVLFDAGLTVETHLLDGDPKHELLKHAESWEADCIFIGARGQQHGQRLALGTMASAVAGRAHCSVEIVRTD